MRRDALVLMIFGLAGASMAVQSTGAVFCVGAGLAASGQNGRLQLHETSTGSLLMDRPISGTPVDAAASEIGAAWLVKTPIGHSVEIRLPSGSVASYPVRAGAERIAWVGPWLAVLSDQGGSLMEPGTGSVQDPSRILPNDIAAHFESSFIEAGSDGMVAFVRPYGLTDVEGGRRTTSLVSLFQTTGSNWRPLGRTLTMAPRYRSITGAKFDGQGRYLSSQFTMSSLRLTLDEAGVVALEEDGLLKVPMLQPVWQPQRVPLNGPPPSWTEPIAAASGRLFRLSQGRLISHNLASGGLEGWLPAGKSFVPQGLTSADGRLYVLERSGPLSLNPNSQGQKEPFFRFSMAPQSMTTEQDTLVKELESWIGVPYRLGGNDRKGIDCSGLVVQTYLKLGMKLPRTSATLRTTNMGTVVTDGLRPGDVICVPGHVAIYVGGDMVIEASSKMVKMNPIWRFRDVVVRRFLRLP
jgi:hypothetical protein